MISKFKLGSDDYLTEQTDIIISKLVKEKEHLFKAYNYYQGFRDKYLFLHLEQNYGVGNPTSIKFTPLIRKHVDAIVGEYLTTKILPQISCKDSRTLTNIMRDKLLAVNLQTAKIVGLFLENAIYQAILGKSQELPTLLPKVDPVIEMELDNVKNDVDLHFISNYEIAALNIVLYILLARRIDFKNKLLTILLDLLIGGEAYYKVIPSPSKLNICIDIEDPLNTFVFKNPDSKYMKDGIMSVVRKWLTREEIAIKYGKYLTKDDLKDIETFCGYTDESDRLTWIAAVNSRGEARTKGILAGVEVTNFYNPDRYSDIELIPVYEVEWIDYDPKSEKGKLYNVTRIGADIYVLDGENDYMVRSIDDPDNIRLTLNGLFYTNRTGVPYSLMLATADLLDLYDLTLFLKDNIIALAGTKGAHVNMSALPAWLGDTPEDRLLKYLGYRKMGLSPLDTSQEGDPNALNTIYNGFDDTLNVNTIQGYLLSLLMIEEIASSITGVFRERLGGIQLRDAVANVEVGMQLSYIITKLYYLVMDTLVSEMLVDSLNLAKKVYKKGFSGEVILGNTKLIFTLLPEYYTFTDFDIHVVDSAELIKEAELIKQLAMQLAGSNLVDPEVLVLVTTSHSLTELKEAVLKSIKEKKIENGQIQQLLLQLEEAQKNMQQMQKQLEASTKKIAQLNEKKLAIEQQDNQVRQNIDWFKAKSEDDNKKQELDLIKERNRLEAALLLDNDPSNDEVLDKKL